MADVKQLAQDQGRPPEQPSSHPLTDEEYQKMVALMGREPNSTERAIFSVMWS